MLQHVLLDMYIYNFRLFHNVPSYHSIQNMSHWHSQIERLRLDLGVLLCHFCFQSFYFFLRLFELHPRQIFLPARFVHSNHMNYSKLELASPQWNALHASLVSSHFSAISLAPHTSLHLDLSMWPAERNSATPTSQSNGTWVTALPSRDLPISSFRKSRSGLKVSLLWI